MVISCLFYLTLHLWVTLNEPYFKSSEYTMNCKIPPDRITDICTKLCPPVRFHSNLTSECFRCSERSLTTSNCSNTPDITLALCPPLLHYGISSEESATCRPAPRFLGAQALDQSAVWTLTRAKNITFDLGKRLICLTSCSYGVYIQRRHWLVFLISFRCLVWEATSTLFSFVHMHVSHECHAVLQSKHKMH